MNVWMRRLMIGIIVFVVVVLAHMFLWGSPAKCDADDLDSEIQCSTVVYYTPSGRAVFCWQCYYPASGLVITFNCN